MCGNWTLEGWGIMQADKAMIAAQASGKWIASVRNFTVNAWRLLFK